jgi:hypothetical protein
MLEVRVVHLEDRLLLLEERALPRVLLETQLKGLLLLLGTLPRHLVLHHSVQCLHLRFPWDLEVVHQINHQHSVLLLLLSEVVVVVVVVHQVLSDNQINRPLVLQRQHPLHSGQAHLQPLD